MYLNSVTSIRRITISSSTRVFVWYALFLLMFPATSSVGQDSADTLSSDQIKIDSLLLLPLDSIHKYIIVNRSKQPSLCQELGRATLSKIYPTHSDVEIGGTHKIIGNMYVVQGLNYLDSAVYHQEKARDYYTKAEVFDMVANINEGLAIDYLNVGQLEKAQATALQALLYYENEVDQEGIAKVSGSLSSVFYMAEDYERSVTYADKALAYFRKAEQYDELFIILNTKVPAQLELENYEGALKDAEESISLTTGNKTTVPVFEAMSYSLRGDVLDKMGRLDEALVDYNKTWKLTEKLYGAGQAEDCRLPIGSTLSKLGQHKKAIPHLEAGIAQYGEQGEHLIVEQLQLSADSYSALGDYKSAYRYSEKTRNIETALQKENIANLESQAMVKYETAKKDAALENQEKELKQQSRIQLLYLALASLLALLLGVLYFYFQKNKKITEQLNIKNNENELLLKEIHHRVKNNLQTISSLLSLQSHSIKDPTAYDAVQESKNRVASMGMIHQKLYQKGNLSSLEMSDYFNTIGKTILESYGDKMKNIKLNVNVEKILLDVDTAVPVGLITNELITNAIKYAFRESTDGVIEIGFSKVDENYTLTVSDNGKHVEQNVQESNAGFGSMLVTLLSKQLRGELTKSTEDGTAVSITFGKQNKSVA